MKKWLMLVLCACVASMEAMNAQCVGKWQGELEVAGNKMPLVVRVASSKKAWMDSPKQMAMNIVCDTVSVSDEKITVGVRRMGILISGDVSKDDNGINGTFTQGYARLPFSMKYISNNPYLERPQTPVPPFDYKCEDVTFSHGDVKLTGELTMPKNIDKDITAVVLVSGSGQQNRDSEMLGHRPFLVLADYLTRNGIAVLRYDDRGMGGSSKCPIDATTNDFAEDALAAVKYLRTVKGINQKKVGIIGHSEGGMIAMMLAAEYPDEVNFIATMAAPTIKGKDLIMRQTIDVAKSNGMAFTDEKIKMYEKVYSSIDTITDIDKMRNVIYNTLSDGLSPQEMVSINSQIIMLTTPWYINFVQYNPAECIAKIKQPVFAMYGANDVQVNDKVNSEALQTLYKGKKLTLKDYDNLNHLFQECEAPTADYGNIEQTISPAMMQDLLNWLIER